MVRYLILGALCFGQVALGQPTWVGTPPSKDARHHFYVGRADLASTEVQGIREATLDAYQQLVQELFGVVATIKTEGCENETSAQNLVHMMAVSENIKVRGFRQVSLDTTVTAQGYNVRVLFKYPIREAAIEQERQATIPVTRAPSSQVITFECRPLKKAEVKMLPVELPFDWYAGLWLGVFGSPSDSISLTSFGAVGTVGREIFSFLSFDLALGLSWGQGGAIINGAKQHQLISGELSAGGQLKFGKFFVGPRVGQSIGIYAQSTLTGRNREILSQPFIGGEIGFLAPKRSGGWGLKLGVRHYGASNGFASGLAVNLQLGLLIGL